MLPEYTVDYEVFLRPAERNENETALQRVSRVTENARYQKAAEALEQNSVPEADSTHNAAGIIFLV